VKHPDTDDRHEMSVSPASEGLKFSIIVPVRNMAETIGRTLDSILSQDFPNIELIVVEGKSTDGTMQRLARYEPRFSHLISEPDSGLYDAVNKGLALATGDIIGILNGDDYYAHPGVLSLYARKFANPDVGIVFGDLEFFPAEQPLRTIRRYSSRGFSPPRLRLGWMPPHPTVFVRNEVYRKVGFYQADYKISADYEFLIRALVDHRIAYDRVDSVVVRMQYGGLSTSGLRASYRLNSEIIRACREHGLKTNWLLILLKVPAKLAEFVIFRR